MLIVNTPGTWDHVFSPLRHAEWHGCTPTDLVFPAFLFIIGVSMWFSFEKYGRQLSPELLIKILKRTALLVLLGLLLAKFPFFWKNFETWRFPGVLVRLGSCYGIASFLVILLPQRILVGVFAVILLGYWAELYFFNPAAPFELETNLVRYLDLMIFGENHIWHGKGIAFDPEGFLSTFPAVCTVIFGWWSGQILQKNSLQKMESVRRLLQFGVILGAVGLVWDLVFPINKYLWTSSYVLYSGGISMVFLAAAVWVLDVKNWERGTRFFQIIGANPLFAFILSGLLTKTMLSVSWLDASKASGKTNVYGWVYENIFAKIDGGAFGSFLFSLVFMLLVWMVCWILYRREIFIKI